MDPRYAFFVWASFGLAAVVVLWNVLAPRFERHALSVRLRRLQDETPEPFETE